MDTPALNSLVAELHEEVRRHEVSEYTRTLLEKSLTMVHIAYDAGYRDGYKTAEIRERRINNGGTT